MRSGKVLDTAFPRPGHVESGCASLHILVCLPTRNLYWALVSRIFVFSVFTWGYAHWFLEREGRESEKHWSVAFYMRPDPGLNLKIKPTTFWCMGQCSNQLCHPARVFLGVSFHRHDDSLAIWLSNSQPVPLSHSVPGMGEHGRTKSPNPLTHVISGMASPILSHLVSITQVWTKGSWMTNAFLVTWEIPTILSVSQEPGTNASQIHYYTTGVLLTVLIAYTVWTVDTWILILHYDKNDDLKSTISIWSITRSWVRHINSLLPAHRR